MSVDGSPQGYDILKRFSQQDFASFFYGDREALAAQNYLNYLCQGAIDDNIPIPGIDTRLLRILLEEYNGVPEDHKCAVNEYNKLRQFVAEQTGVSVERMEEAAKFRNEHLFGK